MALHALQQFVGINIIQIYGPQIMKNAGFGGDSSRDLLISQLTLSLIIAGANFAGTVLGSRLGRREIILLVSIPMGVSLLTLDCAMLINILSPGGKCNLAL